MNFEKGGVPLEQLENLRFISKEYHDKNSGYVFHFNNDQFKEKIKSILDTIPSLKNLINDKSYIVTRRATEANPQHSFMAHFDNYQATTLIPLEIPKSEHNGDICVWEKCRKIPNNLFLHILTKLFFQNILSTAILKYLFINKSRFNNFIRIHVRPGDYLTFNGFVNLHFNLPVEKGERFSLIIHNEKSFENSFMVKLIEKYSRLIVRLNE